MPNDRYPPSMTLGTGLVANNLLGKRYRLIGSLARGGMAEVWEAHDEVLDRDVAIKILHPHLADDPDFVERFRREAVAAARLSHPNVVATYDAGSEQPNGGATVAWIVMELVRGRTLRDFLLEETLSVEASVNVAVQIAAALEQAHRAGIVHRDIKPANILICGAVLDRNVQVKVADFGIARASSDSSQDLTRAGMLVGTAKYLAPEQVEGNALDARTDIYALGVVLYEMLCGRPPFKEESDIATALQHVRSVAPAPRQVRPAIPSAVEAVVVRAMQKQPSERFGSALEFRQALTNADLSADDTMFTAQPDATAFNFQPSAVTPDIDATPPHGMPRRRRRLMPALLICLGVLAIGMVGVALWQGAKDLGGGNDTAEVAAGPLELVSASSFDPEGDGAENESLARKAVDGDPATSWQSDRYNTRNFGNLKSGVGLVATLSSPESISSVVVKSKSKQWSASLYVASSSAKSLGAWGKPLATAQSDASGTISFSLPQPAEGGAVLVWVTDPGSSNRIDIAEITASD